LPNNSALKPKLISIIKKEIMQDIPSAIKKVNRIASYFLLILNGISLLSLYFSIT
jgi:hypothetical protein